ncbi:hypothetical protein QL285_002471 [Trifolium repens]|nr:hypothetical protein QL285_002471 [Trifolium repens]
MKLLPLSHVVQKNLMQKHACMSFSKSDWVTSFGEHRTLYFIFFSKKFPKTSVWNQFQLLPLFNSWVSFQIQFFSIHISHSLFSVSLKPLSSFSASHQGKEHDRFNNKLE